MAVALRKALSVLLVVMLCIMTVWQAGSAVADKIPTASTPICKCCDYDPAKCATPACCARPSDSGAPAAPVVPRCASGNEWQAVPIAPLTVSTRPRCTVHELPVPLPSILVGAVPIFQRDCSFLI
jgi:hypothetical protein